MIDIKYDGQECVTAAKLILRVGKGNAGVFGDRAVDGKSESDREPIKQGTLDVIERFFAGIAIAIQTGVLEGSIGMSKGEEEGARFDIVGRDIVRPIFFG